jgi:hypothetical protein
VTTYRRIQTGFLPPDGTITRWPPLGCPMRTALPPPARFCEKVSQAPSGDHDARSRPDPSGSP